MIPLLAHHLEQKHVWVLLGLFAVGVYVGWQLLGQWLARAPRPVDESHPPPG